MPIDFIPIEKSGSITNRAIASWTVGTQIPGETGLTESFDVKYRIGKGSFNRLNTKKNFLEVDDINPGQKLEVQVRAVGLGFPVKKSAYNKAVSEAAPPIPDIDTETEIATNVSDLTITPVNATQARLEWIAPRGRNLSNFIVIIRHSDKTDGTGSFADSTKMAEVPATATSAVVDLLNGEYILKLKNLISKKKSFSEVSVVINIPDAQSKFLVTEQREETGQFAGDRKGVSYDSANSGLIVSSTEEVDGLFKGEYEFASTEELPGKFDVVLERILKSRGLYPSDLIDDRTALVDSWEEWDGAVPEGTSAAVYFRASDSVATDEFIALESDPDVLLLEDSTEGNDYKLQTESSLSFGDWTALNKATFVGRTFQFKAELESEQSDRTPLVTELGYKLSIPARTENTPATGNTTNPGYYTSGNNANGYPVVFTNAFYQTPSIAITALGLASGDYYELVSTARTGFTIRFKTSGGTVVSRDFKYAASGFGSEQT